LGEGDKAINASMTWRSRLVEIDATDDSFADPRGDGEMLEHFISDEALIDAG